MLIQTNQSKVMAGKYLLYFMQHFHINSEFRLLACCHNFLVVSCTVSRIQTNGNLSTRIQPAILLQLRQGIHTGSHPCLYGIAHLLLRHIITDIKNLVRLITCHFCQIYFSRRHDIHLKAFLFDNLQKGRIKICFYRIINYKMRISHHLFQFPAPGTQNTFIIYINWTAVFDYHLFRLHSSKEACFSQVVLHHHFSFLHFSMLNS